MDPQKITELANLLRQNGDKILNSEFTLTLSGSILRALNDAFTLIADSVEIDVVQNGSGNLANSFQVVKPINYKSPVYSDLQLIYDFVQKTTLLRIVQYPGEENFEGNIDISKFRSLRRLEVQKTRIKQIIGIQALRSQIQQLICAKSLQSIDEVITECGGDRSNGFVWNELKLADFSYNGLQNVQSALEFAQYLQHLNLRHNQLVSATAIKWLPHLKTLDLSYNRLTAIPQLHMEANKHLQTLNLGNNYVEDLLNVTKLEALTELDLSDNCLLDHSTLLPISALITLRYLNLTGNPLHCHPKHRLAAAQFLHKNTATVKFVLDFEPLSKHEKAITGTHQWRSVGSLVDTFTNSTSARTMAKSINAASLTPVSMRTPASSVGSIRTFKFVDQRSTDGEQNSNNSMNNLMNTSTSSNKKRNLRARTVEIEQHVDDLDTRPAIIVNKLDYDLPIAGSKKDMTKSLMLANEQESEYLNEKRQAEELREKYGADWLKFRDTSNVQPLSSSFPRKLFNEYLDEYSTISTPTHALIPPLEENLHNISPIEKLPSNNELDVSEDAAYLSANGTQQNTVFTSAQDDSQQAQDKQEDPAESYVIENIYPNEPEFSEPEDNEDTYMVFNTNRPNESLFLTISPSFIREKDAITHRTKAKWSLKILESCELLRGNTLRINFDTVKSDKQERVYMVEENLCRTLAKKLRDILAQRDLKEMNQIIYRCVNCSCQFSWETRKNKTQKNNQTRCPDCKSTFVAEIHDIPTKPPIATTENDNLKLSPASIVQVSPVTVPLLLETTIKTVAETTAKSDAVEDGGSIGSANSLNGSSSCSKISNSQSSFDSNQSVVGSSNTDREQDFKSTGESEVEIISNPSQSSIEVLDQHQYTGSRKSSEERRSPFIPNLPTIDDQSYTQQCIERYYTKNSEGWSEMDKTDEYKFDDSAINSAAEQTAKTPTNKATKSNTIHPHNLTESSSSGSVTDSVCTAYEQQNINVLDSTQNMLISETKTNNNNQNKGTEHKSIQNQYDAEMSTSLFGALLQSTNVLMSSSKKLIDAESTKQSSSPVLTITSCLPYKFNYNDYTEVDHRLKLYFYQTKFESQNEHFKWIVRGNIYNTNTDTLFPGVVIMTTCKCYLLEAFAPEHDDVSKWLRIIASVTVDRVACLQMLPWKVGLIFHLRDWGSFLLLLQDIKRTDNLMMHFADNELPQHCEVIAQPLASAMQQLSRTGGNQNINLCTLLNECIVTCDNAKRNLNVCCLLTTDSRLLLTTDRLGWLAGSTSDDIEVCLTQLMSNLVDVDTHAPQMLTFSFLDETENKSELWTCTFKTQETADNCLQTISLSWEKLFGFSLMAA